MKQTLLITGGAGYIGSHMVYAALDAGYAVVVADDLSTGLQANLPDDLTLHAGNVGDTAFIKDVLTRHRPAAVLHFAGSVIVPESVRDPAKYYRNNTLAGLALIEACIKAGVSRFVFSSTAAVYGLPPSGVAAEDTPAAPINPYGWSKLMTERMLADTAQAHGLTYAVLRYFNVAGADPAGRTGQSTAGATHLIKVACEVATGKRAAMELFGDDYDTPDGTCVRDYIHVTDLAAAHLAVLGHIETTGNNVTFNCGNGRGYSVREVIGAVETAAGQKLTVHNAPRRPGDPATLIADPGRITAVLDWRAAYTDIGDIVSSALAWERKNVAKTVTA